MVWSHVGTDWLYFLLEMGRCHGILQLESTHRDVAVSSRGRVQPEEGSVSCSSPSRNLQGHTKTHQLAHNTSPSTSTGIVEIFWSSLQVV